MKNQRLLALDNIPIYSEANVESFFKMLPNNKISVIVTVGAVEKQV